MASSRSSSSSLDNSGTQQVGAYSIKEEIGRGSFATVYYGEKMTSKPPMPVAIKVVTRSKLTPKLLDNLESEIRLLTGMSHGNIVEMIDCLKTDSHIYIVMAFCASGDLSQYIKRRGLSASIARTFTATSAPVNERFPNPKEGGLNEVIVRCFLGQLANAMRFLRVQNVIHRDIKPQNVLLQPADPRGPLAGIPILRLADFGFARFLPQASMAETLCGSPLYMAPEILRYEPYDAKADLWSVGAVLYETVVGKAPFRAQNHVELLRKITKGEDRIKFPDDNPKIAPVPADIRALICALLKQKAVDRMSFADFFRVAEIVASSGAAAGIWPPPASADPAIPAVKPPSISPTISRVSSAVPLPSSPLRPTLERQPSTEGAFVASGKPQPAVRHASFAPRYVVSGTSASSQPVDIAKAGIKHRDYAELPSASAARRASEFDKERDTPPDLVPASLEEHSPVAPATPRSVPPRNARSSATSMPMVADEDSVLGREYVLVDRRTVEINALADEISGKRPSSSPATSGRRNSRGFLTRPPSYAGSAQALVPLSSSSGNSTPYPPPSDYMSSTPPFAVTRSRPSPPMRPPMIPYSSSRSPLGAPTAAIARAISMASLKLFGNPSQGILLRRASQRRPISRSAEISDPQEEHLLSVLEDLAQKATVICDFADSRLLLALPPTPSNTSGTTLPTTSSLGRSSPFSGSATNSQIPADVLAAEALMLYLKGLGFLQRGIEKARVFWDAKDAQERQNISADLNDAVQWLRTRFNTCFEKADFAKSRCHEEMPESATSAEKLILDRALELSRAAAVNELMCESPADCEIAYETALRMLYALLDEVSVENQPLDEGFRASVGKFIGPIKARLAALQRKLNP